MLEMRALVGADAARLCAERVDPAVRAGIRAVAEDYARIGPDLAALAAANVAWRGAARRREVAFRPGASRHGQPDAIQRGPLRYRGFRRSGTAKQLLRLPDEPSAVLLADVVVPRNPQQVHRHVVRRACGNRLERPLAIRKMTTVFPEEMPDERLRPMPVAGGTHERVLELPGNPPDVE